MPNEKGWHTKTEVEATGLPYYISASKRWTATPYEFAVLLTKSRCKLLKVAIPTQDEQPKAFRYMAVAGTGTGDKTHRYVPLYDRTSGYNAIKEKLFPHEIMSLK